jgi:hypothetical protein
VADAATIIANIKSQALVGATGAADDLDRIVRYLNKAYLKVYGQLALNYPFLYQQRQEIGLSNGVGTFNPVLYSVVSVADKDNGYRELCQRSEREIAKDDGELAATGNPTWWDRAGLDGIACYPLNDTTLRVIGCPNPALLTADTAEADILIPALHQDVLEWETLWTIAYDERDKLVGAELQFTREMADDCMARLQIFLDAQLPPAERRTKSYLA